MNAAENSLIELAQTASSFMVTLVDQDSISFSDPNAMKSIIERLTKFVLASTFLSLSDKEFAQRNGAGSKIRQEDFFPKNNEAPSPQYLP